MKTKHLAWLLGIALICIAGYYAFGKSDDAIKSDILLVTPDQGPFEVGIQATGELKAKNSIKIRGSQAMRSVGVWQTSIKELIPEGTIVEKGDFVASLDKTELANKITERTTDIEREQTKLEQMQIDTAIQMKDINDQIGNILFNMEQERLEIERNKYEPQMVIDQSLLKLKNSERSLDQLENKKELIEIQSDAKIREIKTNIKQHNSKLALLNKVAGEFTITAPEGGMLIYEKTWNGKKTVGAQISGWDPVVAELPDLSKMISVAYVNEVDISKVKEGQIVNMTIDAFPEKKFTGQIISVANIGQELKNQEAKVFEITIEVDQEDEVMRPAMTTTNKIQIFEYADVTSIPIDALQNDSLDYVWVKNGSKMRKQEVVVGPANEDHIIILAGLSQNDKVSLKEPANAETYTLKLIDDSSKSAAEKQKQEWSSSKEKYDEENKAKAKERSPSKIDKEEGGGGFIIMG